MTSLAVATTIDTLKLETPQLKEEHKVFIGNLSFKTTKESLSSFASTSGKVVDATIITKQRRSLGYGFVTFETEQDAQKAAKDLDRKSLDGREINVEVARPKTDAPANTPQKTRKSKSNARRRSKSTAAGASSSPSSIKEEDSVVPVKREEEDAIVPSIKKKQEDHASDEKTVKLKEEEEVPVKQEASSDDTETTEEKDQEKTPEQIAKEAAARRKRNQQKDKKRQNKKKKSAEKAARVTEPSKTTLFVANLPYATTDDDLNTIFKDYKLVSAHVARMNNGCSKGYGFVELENELEQLKALESIKDVVLEGRSIYLKVALSEQKVPVVVNAESTVEEEVAEEKGPLDKEVKKGEIVSKDAVVDALKVNDTNQWIISVP